MKRLLNLLGIVLALSIVATSCEKAPFLTLSTPKTINFTDQGGTQSITFTANRDWSVSSSDSWCKVSPSSGNKADGNITITLTCEPNTTYDPRSASLTVRVEELSETITVTQDTNLGLLVSPTSYDLTNAAQSIEVEVRANVKYSVEIDAACKDWITQTGTKALSSEKITFSIAANESYDNREGKITIKQTDGNLSETIVVKQSQTNGLFITTPEYDLSNEDHTLSVEVKANVSFQVTPQVDWIKYVETKALTSSTIVLSIEANKTYDDRTGTVLVKQTNGDLSGTITINQKQTDGLFVTPTDVDVDNAEHFVELEVKNNVSYDVVIPDDAKQWISIKSNTATKALADNKVTLAIAQNATYDNREASITIKQTDGPLAETVKIKQAQTDYLEVEKTSYSVSNQSQTLDVLIKSNIDFEVAPDVNWIQYVGTKSVQSSTATLQVLENEEYKERTGIVSIRQKNGDLSVSIEIVQASAIPLDVKVNEAGTLMSLIGDNYESITGLNIYGQINGTDILLIRRMKKLRYLDLSNAKIVSGGVAYFESYYTNDNVIGDYMFYQSPITYFVFPKGITEIRERAFYYAAIETITIPKDVELQFEAFSHSAIKSLYFEEGITRIGTEMSGAVFSYCHSLKDVYLPSTIKKVRGFMGCSSLSNIELPEGLEEIEGSAFDNTGLKNITIPSTVKKIGWLALGSYFNTIHIKVMPDGLTLESPVIRQQEIQYVTVYVPKGTKEKYFLTEFGDCKEMIEE